MRGTELEDIVVTKENTGTEDKGKLGRTCK